MIKQITKKISVNKNSDCQKDSVKSWLDQNKATYFIIIPMLFFSLVAIFPIVLIEWLFKLLNVMFIISHLFKFILVIFSFKSTTKNFSLQTLNKYPFYSILLPVYKEEKIIEKQITSISKIEYPQDKLDAKLLIEEDDIQTLEKLKNLKLPSFMEILIIPNSFPKTKPKACNYALQFLKGKYVVVYDAEDIPCPKQLKIVASLFSELPSNVVCIQTRLNYYNKKYNLLTRLFALEYSLLFEHILLGLNNFLMPIPLGGSSNHFITAKLIKLGGWDSYNVTEDADLGIRIYRKGYRCALIDNETLEESPIHIKSWIIQRSRWIKGHVLTSLLNLHNLKYFKFNEIIGIIFYLYIPNLTYILIPIFIIICIIKQIKPEIGIIFYLNLYLSIFTPIFYSFFIVCKNNWKNMKLSILFSPLYYLLFTLAAIRAFYQIFCKPFYWDKTDHGQEQKNK